MYYIRHKTNGRIIIPVAGLAVLVFAGAAQAAEALSPAQLSSNLSILYWFVGINLAVVFMGGFMKYVVRYKPVAVSQVAAPTGRLLRKMQQAAGEMGEAGATLLRPSDVAAFVSRGKAYAREERWAEAMTDFDQAVEIDPNDAAAYYSRGEVFSRQGRWQDAVGDFDQVTLLEPDNYLAWYNRGEAYSWMEQYAEAYRDLTVAVRLDPEHGPTHYSLGEVRMEQGRYPEAIDHLSEAIRINPEDAESYHMRGLAYLATQQGRKGCTDLTVACDKGVCTGLQFAQKQGACTLD
jgi:tetratricopeptide (TPR) repeat protein